MSTQYFVSDLVNVTSYGKEKITFETERGDITFFCHACNKIVETERIHPQKMKFSCAECKSKRIAIGTNEGIKEHYAKKMRKNNS